MAIKLHGKDYIEVKDRVAAAHADVDAQGFSMLGEETFEMGGRAYVRVVIDVKGKQYIGTAEIKFNANPKTPDGMSPLECGETSALGRALGFAGYGVLDSIASADEVVRNLDNAPVARHNGHQEASTPEKPQPPQTEALPVLIGNAKKRASRLGLASNKPTWEALLQEGTGEAIQEKDLTLALVARLNGHLTKVERERAQAQAS